MEKGKGVMGSGGRRWGVDFSDNSTSRDIPDPPGFCRTSLDQDDSTLSRQKKDAESNWKAQKAWEVAQAPMKNLLMMGFMMWMAGSTVHLFSIGITFSALWQPISALQSVGKMFEGMEGVFCSIFCNSFSSGMGDAFNFLCSNSFDVRCSSCTLVNMLFIVFLVFRFISIFLA
ncbi:ER membrane protein complex subunit 4-like isoform X2 [Glycine soja]|uniref:uncharacterized protein isoform X1 n=1 Tax=Glycine max TaxID=3847 RepID=UPI0003DEA5B4|nr:uncharacterized protein LOC100305631 isoform X1 [Glycine max]XP_028201143.1 ER membrane protein complex subunit 4-like isoform X2 [Glycine soja]|eukprot:XP_006595494.1 uncharacterized protein LOC100305631 isoform X1 [Glycine max]